MQLWVLSAPVSLCIAHLRGTDENIWLQESRLTCLCGSSCRRAQSGLYLSSAHLQHARLKHLLDSITQQGLLDSVRRSGQAEFSFTPQQKIVIRQSFVVVFLPWR